jgi:hypothetical protein
MRQIPFLALVQFSSSAEAGRRGSPARGLSKLSSVAEPASSPKARPSPDHRSGRRFGTPPRRSAGTDSLGNQAGTARMPRELPRKEVIQPQLPLRLPCYDFTPITSPTFDGSLP